MPVHFGGGTDAHFTGLLNRIAPHADAPELICYPINPQVHAFDNLSLVETLAAQAATVQQRPGLCGGAPHRHHPGDFAPLFQSRRHRARGAARTRPLPSSVDVCQMSPFAAAWTLGSLKYLPQSGALPVSPISRPCWLVRGERRRTFALFPSLPGAVFPVYHLLA